MEESQKTANSARTAYIAVLVVILILVVLLIVWSFWCKRKKPTPVVETTYDNTCSIDTDCAGKCLENNLLYGTCICAAGGQCEFSEYPVNNVPYTQPNTQPESPPQDLSQQCGVDADCQQKCLQFDLSKGSCTCQSGSCVYQLYDYSSVPYSVKSNPRSVKKRNMIVQKTFLNDNGVLSPMFKNTDKDYLATGRLPSVHLDAHEIEDHMFDTDLQFAPL
jgi:hypothetical protein